MLSIHLPARPKLYIAALLAMTVLTPNSGKADDDHDNVYNILHDFYGDKPVQMQALVQVHQDPTYVTAKGGWNLGGNGHFGDQILEADLNPHFNWFNISDWVKFLGRLDGFVNITGRIRLRMSSEPSAPVRTPSFMPRATLYLWLRDKDNTSNGNYEVRNRADYFSLMLSHHSNGQDGQFYNPDGSINTNSGSFSTNFLQLAYYRVTTCFPWWTKISLDWHPGFNRSGELKDQYEKVKASVEFRTRPFYPNLFGLQFRNFSKISYTLSGRDYIIAPNPAFPAIAPRKAQWSDNIHLSTELHIKPSIWEDMRIFLKYDLGYDYYNIHFRERINRIQIGVSGYAFSLSDKHLIKVNRP